MNTHDVLFIIILMLCAPFWIWEGMMKGWIDSYAILWFGWLAIVVGVISLVFN